MKVAYLDCSMGISGDMTLSALVDAGVPRPVITAAIDSLGLPGVSLAWSEVMRCGFRALHLKITHPEQHAHRGLREIRGILGNAKLTAGARQIAERTFELIAEAEARVHGSTPEEIHFHEVGAIDSICDIVGVAVGFDALGVDAVYASAVPTGRGRVTIAHGICPVPTPGTLELLRGIPTVDIPVEAELTTPTGAAILRAIVKRFGPRPEITVDRIGYGAGTKDFADRSNVLRILVGEVAGSGNSTVSLLETNLDNATGEVIGHTRQLLFSAGALDVYTHAIQMKKDRPGVLLSVLCRLEDAAAMESIVFRETGTLGIRRSEVVRNVLPRAAHSVKTTFGIITGKLRWLGDLAPRFSVEYESAAEAARKSGVALQQVIAAAELAYAQQPVTSGPPTVDVGTGSPTSSGPVSRPISGHDHDHRHDHDHDHGKHDHDHRHDHDHDHKHDHDHRHDHDQKHDHDHGKHDHDR